MNAAGILIIRRALLNLIKKPMAPLSGLFMSLFFLAVYSAGIGGISDLPAFKGGGYIAFLMPLCIVSLSIGSSSGAGQSLFKDMESGYFKRLFLSPAPRWSFVAAALIADIVVTIIFTAVLLFVGMIFGMPLRLGLPSFLGVLLLSLLWGMILSGLSAGVMLRTGDAKGAQMVIMVVFPFLFLSTSFLPRELITAKWLLGVSWGNPVTYMFESMRYLIAGTASFSFFLAGILLTSIGAFLAFLFALTGSKKILV